VFAQRNQQRTPGVGLGIGGVFGFADIVIELRFAGRVGLPGGRVGLARTELRYLAVVAQQFLGRRGEGEGVAVVVEQEDPDARRFEHLAGGVDDDIGHLLFGLGGEQILGRLVQRREDLLAFTALDGGNRVADRLAEFA